MIPNQVVEHINVVEAVNGALGSKALGVHLLFRGSYFLPQAQIHISRGSDLCNHPLYIN